MYATSYSTKPIDAQKRELANIGTGLADLLSRLREDKEGGEEGVSKTKVSQVAEAQKRLQRILSSHDKSFPRSLVQLLGPYLGTFKDSRLQNERTVMTTHRFWNVQMKQVLFIGDRMLKLVRGEDVRIGADDRAAAAAPIDRKLLKEKCAKGEQGTLLDCVRTNNLADFMYRCRGEREHPFVDASSYWSWARYMYIMPIEKCSEGNVRQHRPAEYVRPSEAHPREDEIMIHIRTMAPHG
eukprot:gene2554-12474_t